VLEKLDYLLTTIIDYDKDQFEKVN